MGEKKQLILGLVSEHHVLGIEEAVLGKSDEYTTSAVCYSQQVVLYRVDREYFKMIFK